MNALEISVISLIFVLIFVLISVLAYLIYSELYLIKKSIDKSITEIKNDLEKERIYNIDQHIIRVDSVRDIYELIIKNDVPEGYLGKGRCRPLM